MNEIDTGFLIEGITLIFSNYYVNIRNKQKTIINKILNFIILKYNYY